MHGVKLGPVLYLTTQEEKNLLTTYFYQQRLDMGKLVEMLWSKRTYIGTAQ